jgi:hypothetical protein
MLAGRSLYTERHSRLPFVSKHLASSHCQLPGTVAFKSWRLPVDQASAARITPQFRHGSPSPASLRNTNALGEHASYCVW